MLWAVVYVTHISDVGMAQRFLFYFFIGFGFYGRPANVYVCSVHLMEHMQQLAIWRPTAWQQRLNEFCLAAI